MFDLITAPWSYYNRFPWWRISYLSQSSRLRLESCVGWSTPYRQVSCQKVWWETQRVIWISLLLFFSNTRRHRHHLSCVVCFSPIRSFWASGRFYDLHYGQSNLTYLCFQSSQPHLDVFPSFIHVSSITRTTSRIPRTFSSSSFTFKLKSWLHHAKSA